MSSLLSIPMVIVRFTESSCGLHLINWFGFWQNRHAPPDVQISAQLRQGFPAIHPTEFPDLEIKYEHVISIFRKQRGSAGPVGSRTRASPQRCHFSVRHFRAALGIGRPCSGTDASGQNGYYTRPTTVLIASEVGGRQVTEMGTWSGSWTSSTTIEEK